MEARQRLNEANVIGSLIWGSLLGFVTGSWAVFIIASAVFIGAAVLGGDIRFKNCNYRSYRR